MRYSCLTAVWGPCPIKEAPAQHCSTRLGFSQLGFDFLFLKDTVALFGISIDFGGIFFFFFKRPATKTNSFSQYSLASQLGGKGS